MLLRVTVVVVSSVSIYLFGSPIKEADACSNCPVCPSPPPNPVKNPFTVTSGSLPSPGYASPSGTVIQVSIDRTTAPNPEDPVAPCSAWILLADGTSFQAIVQPPAHHDGHATFSSSAMCDGFASALHSGNEVRVQGNIIGTARLEVHGMDYMFPGWSFVSPTPGAYSCSGGNCTASNLTVTRIHYYIASGIPCLLELEGAGGDRFYGKTLIPTSFLSYSYQDQNLLKHHHLKVCSAAAAALGAGYPVYIARSAEQLPGRLDIEELDVLERPGVWGSGPSPF